MDPVPMCPRPLRQRDAEALIGLLAIVEVEAKNDRLDAAFVDHLSRRLESVGLLPDGADGPAFRQSLNDLNHRVRYALGENDDPPAP